MGYLITYEIGRINLHTGNPVIAESFSRTYEGAVETARKLRANGKECIKITEYKPNGIFIRTGGVG